MQSKLTPFSEDNGIARKMGKYGVHLLGTSGTVTTIAGVYLGLSEYHRAKVDGCWLSTENIRAVSRRIVGMNYEQRAAQPCIGTERADLILAGCAIMEAMLRIWPGEILTRRRPGIARGHSRHTDRRGCAKRAGIAANGGGNGTAKADDYFRDPTRAEPKPFS